MFKEIVRRGFLRAICTAALLAIAGLGAAACSASAVKEEADSRPVVTDRQHALMNEMNKHAERAYRSMKEGDVENARNRMIQLSAAATQLSYEGLTTIEGMSALTETIGGAMHTFNSVQPNDHESLLATVRVRLAVDALAHHNQPMWLEFHKPMREDLSGIGQSAQKRDAKAAAEALSKWAAHAKLIRPALLISRDPSVAGKLDSMTTFLESSVGKKDWKSIMESMPNLSLGLEDIFRPGDRQTIAPLAPTEEPTHPILWSFSLGTIIVAVLAYVAWRRYHSDSGYTRVKKEQDIDGGY
jgi:sporulation protein YpjB